MSKFLMLGLPVAEIIRATTINAARAVLRDDRGTLKPGLLGDATILTLEDGDFEFQDVMGERKRGRQRFAAKGIVLGGRWWHG
jgi:dihydroorotase